MGIIGGAKAALAAAVGAALLGLFGWAKIERGRAALAESQLAAVAAQRDQAVAVARANEAAIAQQRAEYEHQLEQLRADRDRANQRARSLSRFQQEVTRAREAILDQRVPDSVRDAVNALLAQRVRAGAGSADRGPDRAREGGPAGPVVPGTPGRARP
ncbi:MAG: hypothetical protein JNL66_07715 [Alphaproteobacteria bacterium]|nr:hypothetical protein [Alphaproteobacteria bacterium]